jgi:hypothetical protein
VRKRCVGAAVAACIVLSACAGPRNSLNTAASVCFRALPAARDVVHGKGRLVGVRRRSTATLTRRFPGVTVPRPGDPVCIVAYRGDYKAGEVKGATGTGRYAVVVVDAKSMHVLRTRVTDVLPLRFRHPV